MDDNWSLSSYILSFTQIYSFGGANFHPSSYGHGDGNVDKKLLPPTSLPYPHLSKKFFRRHGRDLFSYSFTSFLVDIVFYRSTLFQSLISKQYLPKSEKENAYQAAFEVTKLQAIMAACFTIPGYWFTIYFIDKIGRVKIQMMGFFFMALVFFVLGINKQILGQTN